MKTCCRIAKDKIANLFKIVGEIENGVLIGSLWNVRAMRKKLGALLR